MTNEERIHAVETIRRLTEDDLKYRPKVIEESDIYRIVAAMPIQAMADPEMQRVMERTKDVLMPNEDPKSDAYKSRYISGIISGSRGSHWDAYGGITNEIAKVILAVVARTKNYLWVQNNTGTMTLCMDKGIGFGKDNISNIAETMMKFNEETIMYIFEESSSVKYEGTEMRPRNLNQLVMDYVIMFDRSIDRIRKYSNFIEGIASKHYKSDPNGTRLYQLGSSCPEFDLTHVYYANKFRVNRELIYVNPNISDLDKAAFAAEGGSSVCKKAIPIYAYPFIYYFSDFSQVTKLAEAIFAASPSKKTIGKKRREAEISSICTSILIPKTESKVNSLYKFPNSCNSSMINGICSPIDSKNIGSMPGAEEFFSKTAGYAKLKDIYIKFLENGRSVIKKANENNKDGAAYYLGTKFIEDSSGNFREPYVFKTKMAIEYIIAAISNTYVDEMLQYEGSDEMFFLSHIKCTDTQSRPTGFASILKRFGKISPTGNKTAVRKMLADAMISGFGKSIASKGCTYDNYKYSVASSDCNEMLGEFIDVFVSDNSKNGSFLLPDKGEPAVSESDALSIEKMAAGMMKENGMIDYFYISHEDSSKTILSKSYETEIETLIMLRALSKNAFDALVEESSDGLEAVPLFAVTDMSSYNSYEWQYGYSSTKSKICEDAVECLTKEIGSSSGIDASCQSDCMAGISKMAFEGISSGSSDFITQLKAVACTAIKRSNNYSYGPCFISEADRKWLATKLTMSIVASVRSSYPEYYAANCGKMAAILKCEDDSIGVNEMI